MADPGLPRTGTTRRVTSVRVLLKADDPYADVRAANAALLKERDALREQLDAAVELAKDIIDFTKNEAPDEWDGGNIGYSLGGICSLADDFLVACAALGVGDD